MPSTHFYTLELPPHPGCNRNHQDSYILRLWDPYNKPSFGTGILGKAKDPTSYTLSTSYYPSPSSLAKVRITYSRQLLLLATQLTNQIPQRILPLQIETPSKSGMICGPQGYCINVLCLWSTFFHVVHR